MNLSGTRAPTLIAPYGGTLVNLTTPAESYSELKAYASRLPSIQISPRFACDLELLATGAFSPLDRFMGREDYQCVLSEMRLADGHIYPIPLTLAVEPTPGLHLDTEVALRNNEYELMAIMSIDEIYEWDRSELAAQIFGTQDIRHPLVAELQNWGSVNISGRLQVLNLPRHYDFQDLWLTPTQARSKLAEMERENVVAYQPHTSWQSLGKGISWQAINGIDGTLLFQPVVGLTKLGDVDHYTRVRTYLSITKQYSKPGRILLSLLPLATRMAGPREALWQALIRRNYGANHMIVSQDHASPANSPKSRFYGPAEAQKLVEKYSQELGVKVLPEPEQPEEAPKDTEALRTFSIVNIQINNGRRKNGHSLPDGFSGSPEATDILAESYLPWLRQGVCVWFTGLSGSGKSTTAEVLTWLLLEHGRRVTVLDGDVVRTHLSKGLGFSKTDRDINVRRIGFVASELVSHGGVVICAVVSPYRASRNDVRNMVGNDYFVEVYVNTPLEVCELRDVKGFYAKARQGQLKGFTGIDDPYELPDHPEIILDTVSDTPQENASLILDYLVKRGHIENTITDQRKV